MFFGLTIGLVGGPSLAGWASGALGAGLAGCAVWAGGVLAAGLAGCAIGCNSACSRVWCAVRGGGDGAALSGGADLTTSGSLVGLAGALLTKVMMSQAIRW